MASEPWREHPEYQALLAGIREQPDEDAPRLVLADWLEEHTTALGAVRAEFIRVQVALARLPAHDPERFALKAREVALLKEHEAEWLELLPELVSTAEFHRGFVESIRLGARQFLDHAAAIFDFAPIRQLQLLRLNQTKFQLAELVDNPHFRALRGLSLRNSSLGDERVAELLRAARLDRLEELDLVGSGAADVTLAALCDAHMPRLRSLNLGMCPLGGHLHRLTSWLPPAPLRELDLGMTSLQRGDFETLWDWPALVGLERLTLSNNRLGAAGAREMAKCPRLRGLRSLDLHGCQIGISGMRALAECPFLTGLESLELGRNSLKRAGLEALLASPHLTRLDALEVAGNELGDDVMSGLAASAGLARFRILDLRQNGLTVAGVRTLLGSPHLGGLSELDLSDNVLSDAVAVSLADCPRLAGLVRLDLRVYGLGEQGVRQLLASPHLRGLRELNLDPFHLSHEIRSLLAERFPESPVS